MRIFREDYFTWSPGPTVSANPGVVKGPRVSLQSRDVVDVLVVSDLGIWQCVWHFVNDSMSILEWFKLKNSQGVGLWGECKRVHPSVKTGVDDTETTQVTLKQRERERKKEIDIWERKSELAVCSSNTVQNYSCTV